MALQVYYTPTALADMAWFRRYYGNVFPNGYGGARRSLQRAVLLLSNMPEAGRISDFGADLRQIPLRRTPFCILYRVRPAGIEIIRIIDTRSVWPFGAAEEI